MAGLNLATRLIFHSWGEGGGDDVVASRPLTGTFVLQSSLTEILDVEVTN